MHLLIILGFIFMCYAAEVSHPPNCSCPQLHFAEEATTVSNPSPTFPATSFTCWGRYDGYYADIEVDCTIFHYCQTFQYPSGLNETVKWDFACPQDTIFNQKVLSCTLPNVSFDCQESPNYYWINYNLTSPTTTSPPSPEPTTPNSNVGQQLIIGGLEPQSAEFSKATDSAVFSPSGVAPTEPEPGSGQQPSEKHHPQAIHFVD